MENGNKKDKVRKVCAMFYLLILVAIPVVLLILPADYFDNGKTICLSVLLFNRTCPGCGMTRAVQHMIHFDFTEAWHYNRMSVVVVPLLIGIWVGEVYRMIKKVFNKNISE